MYIGTEGAVQNGYQWLSSPVAAVGSAGPSRSGWAAAVRA